MNKSRFDNKLSRPGLALQPLYKQVEEHVTQLIVEQRWKPGEMLPSEFQLASELDVSQGTVRKALNSLTDANILNRKQGIGTFVSEHTGHHSLYRFFPLIADGKTPELPKAELMSVNTQVASKQVAKALELTPKSKVIVLSRRRILNNEFCMAETIFLPYKYFAKLEEQPEVPHTLYHFYQTQFNLTVRDTRDSIKAVLATKDDAQLLAIQAGQPLLEVTRVTHSLDNKAIEYRVSRCRSDHYHYLVELG
ncbi:GntR family transcriptional regulator [uncultured Paraglaciecola sp.]|uniref:GntR family transcriptional regulator n=1 Tax=uncultured Paraglaciecola sp. TaxID=1765024 RepID=UPI002626D494|nr:GntR family transcriptional regulator [uncultured Paraglaciecola sp.]